MFRSVRLLLIMITLVGGVGLALACGGDDDGGEPTADATTDGDGQPTAPDDEPTADATEADATEEDDGGASGGSSFEDIPLPDGATETFSGEFSGGSVPIPAGDLDAGAYGNLQYATYEVDQSADDVFQFYQDEMGDWDEVATFSGGAAAEAGAYGAWTKDNQAVVAWVGITEADGVTSLVIYRGERET